MENLEHTEKQNYISVHHGYPLMWAPLDMMIFIDKTQPHLDGKYFLPCYLLAGRTSSMERQCQAPADWNRASYRPGWACACSFLQIPITWYLRLDLQYLTEVGLVPGNLALCWRRWFVGENGGECETLTKSQSLKEAELHTFGPSVLGDFSQVALPPDPNSVLEQCP